MKKNIAFLISFLLISIFSCTEDDGKNDSKIEPVSNVTSTSFIGSVILNWENPDNEDFYYVLITYKDSGGKEVRKKVSKYDINEDGLGETTVGGFTDTNEHVFNLRSVGYSGVISSAVEISGIPQNTQEAMNYVIETITVDPISSGARISWVNETGVSVKLKVFYVNREGENIEVEIDAGVTGSYVLAGITKTTVLTIVAKNDGDEGETDPHTFEVTPLIDPDDIVYDDVDYITFGTGANQVSFTQDNPDNVYEYTFVTFGGDPNINCYGMHNSIAGKVLVFRYQSTESFTLELFWCDAGGGAAGGRSTSVEVPENNTGEWQTFRYDYTEAMAQHSWMGNAGDFMRFDLGTKAGLTIKLKNIHFE
ncbi:MAG: DUF4959 domain-containing protein [Parabacteroides sp.]|uniref:DUF4959 domain-containing protein n=1 Tax=Parabacteroides faecalis TaxID=2924040 RepID=A0ABT0BWV3_9BACT|nr:DUF4959 domain-containing protein [Parabacteroides faecalis]MCI7286560.1 DUF4959 domain-containing protein [Parabacteroides sp.]MCJ2379221.1 DUF4959 domain-containing protein [Parabacteroides faecalis]MDD7562716.1 DUF4959 domain-containing protein [Parabacteroides sp.]MDY6254563.1 DUF4959 domain-containing protein [Bacteroidales bacterium]